MQTQNNGESTALSVVNSLSDINNQLQKSKDTFACLIDVKLIDLNCPIIREDNSRVDQELMELLNNKSGIMPEDLVLGYDPVTKKIIPIESHHKIKAYLKLTGADSVARVLPKPCIIKVAPTKDLLKHKVCWTIKNEKYGPVINGTLMHNFLKQFPTYDWNFFAKYFCPSTLRQYKKCYYMRQECIRDGIKNPTTQQITDKSDSYSLYFQKQGNKTTYWECNNSAHNKTLATTEELDNKLREIYVDTKKQSLKKKQLTEMVRKLSKAQKLFISTTSAYQMLKESLGNTKANQILIDIVQNYKHNINKLTAENTIDIDKSIDTTAIAIRHKNILNKNSTYQFIKNNISIAKTPTEEEVSKACLLYTSPSPRDRQKSRMPSSA